MAHTVQTLFQEIVPAKTTAHNKVTFVGVGQVGMACAHSVLQQVGALLGVHGVVV